MLFHFHVHYLAIRIHIEATFFLFAFWVMFFADSVGHPTCIHSCSIFQQRAKNLCRELIIVILLPLSENSFWI